MKLKIDKEALEKVKGVFLTANVIAAIIGALIGGSFALYIDQKNHQMSEDELEIRLLILQEANFVLNGDKDKAVNLYASNALVIDAAGGQKSLETTWVGTTNIKERYDALPTFVSLYHNAVNVEVTGGQASATADTVGAYVSKGETITISSNQGEKWGFDRIDDTWQITSFTYNLPQSI
jgi:hypothetical protein